MATLARRIWANPNQHKAVPIADEIASWILTRKIKPGEFIRSVRFIAHWCSVNPKTAHKALLILKERGLLTSIPRVGYRSGMVDERILTLQRNTALSQKLVSLDKLRKNLNIHPGELARLKRKFISETDRESELQFFAHESSGRFPARGFEITFSHIFQGH